MTGLPPGWAAALRARLQREPERPRVPLKWQGRTLGSVEPGLLQALHAAQPSWRDEFYSQGDVAELRGGELQPLLHRLADALRDAGLGHAWRNEQLPVKADDGTLLATIERGVVRSLGIATWAVHLVGVTPDGRHWGQLRSLTKANDPGLWDTLMGGMVPAGEDVASALARETWEEAGLRLDQLRDLSPAGRVDRRGPTGDGRHGFVAESIDWYRCVVPEGVVPANQDGEVDHFELLAPDELVRRLAAGQFTLEASAIYAQALGAW